MAKSILSTGKSNVQSQSDLKNLGAYQMLKSLCHYMTDVTQPEIKLRKEAVLSYLNGNPTISKEQL